MIPMEMQTHDHLVELFTKLVGASGLAPTVSGPMGPRELFDNLLQCAPFLRDTHVRPEDGLAQVQTGTFDMAWSIFYNGRESVALFILTRFEGNYSMQLLRMVIDPFKEMAEASGLQFSLSSKGDAEPSVVAAMRDTASIPMDRLFAGEDVSIPAQPSGFADPGPMGNPYPHNGFGAQAAAGFTQPPPPPPPSGYATPPPPAAPWTPAPPQARPVPAPPDGFRPTPATPPPPPPAAPRTPAPPQARPVPAPPVIEGQQLTAGANATLPPESVDRVLDMELGWFGAVEGIELDASAILLDERRRVLSDEHFVFFNNLRSPDGAVELTPHTTTDGAGYVIATLSLSLTALPPQVHSIVFPVSIYDAESRRHSFGKVPTAFARIRSRGTSESMATFVMNCHAGATESAMVFAEVYRRGEAWKIRAVGQGYASGLAGIATDYGVNVG